jgi:hypothetical protein
MKFWMRYGAIWRPRNMRPNERKSNMIALIPTIVWLPMSWSDDGMQPCNTSGNLKHELTSTRITTRAPQCLHVKSS